MRTLKRPMFNKGGSTNEGIMTGLVDRRKYANGNAADLFQSLNPERFEGEADLYTNMSPADVKLLPGTAEKRGTNILGGFFKYFDPQEQNIRATTKKISEIPYVPGAEKNIPGTPLVKDPQPFEARPEFRKKDGETEDIDNDDIKQIIADRRSKISRRAKEFTRIMSPNAMKKVTIDALTAASEEGKTSTGNTIQDLTNMLTSAAKASGGARTTMDKAIEYAILEDIKINTLREASKYKNFAPAEKTKAINALVRDGMDPDIARRTVYGESTSISAAVSNAAKELNMPGIPDNAVYLGAQEFYGNATRVNSEDWDNMQNELDDGVYVVGKKIYEIETDDGKKSIKTLADYGSQKK